MRLILALSLLLLSACASVNSVSLTSIPAKKGKEVRSQSDKFIIFGFNFNNDYVDEMANDLKRQCPGGQITGILTKDESIDYFLMIVYKRQVTATGYCIKADTAQVPASNQNGKKL